MHVYGWNAHRFLLAAGFDVRSAKPEHPARYQSVVRAFLFFFCFYIPNSTPFFFFLFFFLVSVCLLSLAVKSVELRCKQIIWQISAKTWRMTDDEHATQTAASVAIISKSHHPSFFFSFSPFSCCACVACSIIIRDMGANRLGTLNKDAFKGMILLNEL